MLNQNYIYTKFNQKILNLNLLKSTPLLHKEAVKIEIVCTHNVKYIKMKTWFRWMQNYSRFGFGCESVITKYGLLSKLKGDYNLG